MESAQARSVLREKVFSDHQRRGPFSMKVARWNIRGLGLGLDLQISIAPNLPIHVNIDGLQPLSMTHYMTEDG